MSYLEHYIKTTLIGTIAVGIVVSTPNITTKAPDTIIEDIVININIDDDINDIFIDIPFIENNDAGIQEEESDYYIFNDMIHYDKEQVIQLSDVIMVDQIPIYSNRDFCGEEDEYYELPTSEMTINIHLGDRVIYTYKQILISYNLPSAYYNNLDYSSFQPYMPYTALGKYTPNYKMVTAPGTYTDSDGLRRSPITPGELQINGQDDYVIALGTYYKPKGEIGSRYLFVTTNGMYTAITCDEKDDRHTDSMGMYSYHGNKVGLIEWIVDSSKLNPEIRKSGSVTNASNEILAGEILYIYRIES